MKKILIIVGIVLLIGIVAFAGIAIYNRSRFIGTWQGEYRSESSGEWYTATYTIRNDGTAKLSWCGSEYKGTWKSFGDTIEITIEYDYVIETHIFKYKLKRLVSCNLDNMDFKFVKINKD